MKFGSHFAAACGLAAFLAMSAPATAANISYNLVGDTATTYPSTLYPQWSFIDLSDANTGSSLFPGYTLNVGDTVNLTLTLTSPISFTDYTVWMQEAPAGSMINFNPTYLYSLGGATVPVPSSNWGYTIGSGDGLAFGGTYVLWGSETFSFDKVIVSAVITSMTDATNQSVTSLGIAEGWAGVSIFNVNPQVATTPLPGGLLLMMTGLGGLGIVARRKRAMAS